jgi:putative adhesin
MLLLRRREWYLDRLAHESKSTNGVTPHGISTLTATRHFTADLLLAAPAGRSAGRLHWVMHSLLRTALALAVLLATAAPVVAQRLTFERTFDVGAAPVVDVSTLRGKIDVTAGEPGRITISGSVTIRAGITGITVPADAAEVARRIAEHPPIMIERNTVRLQPPPGDADRAVTVAYRVRVPLDSVVRTDSDSGATTIEGVSGSVTVRTKSGAIRLSRLAGAASIVTGSGAVAAENLTGPLAVTTGSSAFNGVSLHELELRTASGAVEATFVGRGDVDVETGSSSVVLRGLDGALRVTSRSGRIEVAGAPSAPWQVWTGSGSVAITLDRDTSAELAAKSGSGSIRVDGMTVTGRSSKREVAGTLGAGGPMIKVNSRSGSIRITARNGT